jgi:hypothetical protein
MRASHRFVLFRPIRELPWNWSRHANRRTTRPQARRRLDMDRRPGRAAARASDERVRADVFFGAPLAHIVAYEDCLKAARCDKTIREVARNCRAARFLVQLATLPTDRQEIANDASPRDRVPTGPQRARQPSRRSVAAGDAFAGTRSTCQQLHASATGAWRVGQLWSTCRPRACGWPGIPDEHGGPRTLWLASLSGLEGAASGRPVRWRDTESLRGRLPVRQPDCMAR